MINRTTWLSVVFVLMLSSFTASAIILTFASGYAESGIVDTTIEEKCIEEGESNQVLRFTSDQLNSTDPDIKEKTDQAGNSFLYFSVVTFTTLGYGDFQPTKESRALAAVEALFGMGFMAFLVAVLFQLLLDRARYARSKETVPTLWYAFKLNGSIVVFSLVLIYMLSSFLPAFP